MNETSSGDTICSRPREECLPVTVEAYVSTRSVLYLWIPGRQAALPCRRIVVSARVTAVGTCRLLNGIPEISLFLDQMVYDVELYKLPYIL
jgi:hypothetical protein